MQRGASELALRRRLGFLWLLRRVTLICGAGLAVLGAVFLVASSALGFAIFCVAVLVWAVMLGATLLSLRLTRRAIGRLS